VRHRVAPPRFVFFRPARDLSPGWQRDIRSMTNIQSPTVVSRKLNILLAEDNLVNRVLAQKLLQKFGHTVTLANNGKEGATLWESHQANQFDVILMDIQMPLMDGLQATAYIRAKERYLAGGMDGYVSKPVNSAELEKVIQSVVDQFPSRARALAGAVPSMPGTLHPDLSDGNASGTEEAEILARFDGDIELVRELAGIFIDECPNYLAAIREAVLSANPKALEHSSHTLKGSLGNFSTKDAHAFALQLETLGRSGSVDGAAEILQKLEEQLEGFNRILAGMAKETVHRSQ
jgi:two-component system sensor histidine kinase/response regulator